ncbi:MAG TPA: alpha-galactosidase, partial [Bacteroidales bacterium]|nr:alpha-galactosidase [Bacteroidales bacterium]
FCFPKPDAKECLAVLENGILTLGNSKISRTYNWNDGNLITISIKDKTSGTEWSSGAKKPDLLLPGESEKAHDAVFTSEFVTGNDIMPHLRAELTYFLGKVQVKRVFRIYPGCQAIACDLYYRGESANTWLRPEVNMADMSNIEKLNSSYMATTMPVIEKLELPGRHWEIEAVEFFDITDRFNNLVRTVKALSYRPAIFRGNILFAQDKISGNGIFMLKEAPASNVQLAYPGCDFISEYGAFRISGAGISSGDLDRNEWKRGYGFVTGIYSGGEYGKLAGLRNYQKNIRILKPELDEMVLMNTWGDRGQDTRIGEKFAIAELEAGAKLGISHFQLDDGWQTGRSSNSAFTGGSLESIWNNPKYWEPNPDRFPEGLGNVVKRGKELGIEICLWFNPSKDDENSNWEKDADVLIDLHKKYGIRTFKIDGVNLPTKNAELNFRKMLDKVDEVTEGQVVFNLDVTAMRRGGYHWFNEYGNLFLENRYTDWTNYYPYTTLRNLWMLSRYVPAEKLQIEFLNKWRNTEKYTGDPFAPSLYRFDYLFAVTMAAQPLAWFEGTGLPAEAFDEAAPVIRKYRKIQHDLHSGCILPVGEEPSGRSWTGFQSIKERNGYFIIFRENNEEESRSIKTWLPSGTRIRCTPVLGSGKPFSAKAGQEGTIKFRLASSNSYTLYSYEIL